jgi:hypothetical protein
LVIDAMGNLYGTTFNGGAGSCVNGNGAVIGCGTAFELMPNSEGGYSEKILHSFNYNGRDGYNPLAGLILDVAGNLYGTTLLGGSGTCSDGNGVVIGCGAVFELTPATNGCWSEQILHSFHNNGTDGVGPYSGVVFDAAGNLYGTTIGGGIYAYGTVYELTPRTGGGWRQMILHNFEDADGQEPRGGVILDGLGNLYGTTLHGGTFFNGVAFELSPQTDGPWTEIVLHSFGGSGDGFIPDSGPIFDQAGNLDGTTDLGGSVRPGRHRVRVNARRRRQLDRDRHVQLRQRYRRMLSPGRPHPRCQRQSLRHHARRRHGRFRYGVRTHCGRRRSLERDPTAQLRRGRGWLRS